MTASLRQRIEQQIRHIVGQRAADEKLHREVVDALWVLALVRVLCQYPPLGKDVPHRAGEGLKTIARVGACRIDDVVKEQVAFVQAALCPREMNRAGVVLIEELRKTVETQLAVGGSITFFVAI